MRDLGREAGVVKRKIASIQELEFLGNQEAILSILNEWIKKSPDNEALNKVVAASIENSFYVNRLQKDAMSFGMILAEERKEKNKLTLELREVKEKLRIFHLESKL